MSDIEKDFKVFVENLRGEWKLMWQNMLEDKVRAEGIATKDYEQLFVERGQILFATKDFKPVEFRAILEAYLTPEAAERANPNSHIGGIHKFIRENITKNNDSKRKHVRRRFSEPKKKHQHLKHGGKGWLHYSMRSNE